MFIAERTDDAGENMEENRKKKMSGKKKAAIAAAAVLIAAIGANAIASGRRAANNEIPSGVVQGTVERGDIYETVTGTGSLSADESEEVTAPVGVEVEKVFVKSGDTVRRGDHIATVSELSVKEQLLSIQESIDRLQDEIDDLDSEDENYELTKEVRQGELNDLISTRADMEKLQKSCVITATADGIVDAVNIEEGEEITKNSFSSSTSGSLDTSSIDLSTLLQGRAEQEERASSQGKAGSRKLPETATAPVVSGEENEVSDNESNQAGSENGAEESAAGSSADTGSTAAGSSTEADSSVIGGWTETDGSVGSDDSSVSEDSSAANDTESAAQKSDNTTVENSVDLRAFLLDGVEGTGLYGGPVLFHVEAPKEGAVPQSSVELPESMHSSATISWAPSDSTFQSGTAYTAEVTITAQEDYYFIDSVTDAEGNTFRTLYVFADTCPSAAYTAHDLDGDGRSETLKLVLSYAETSSAQFSQEQLEALEQQIERLAKGKLQELKEGAVQTAQEVSAAGITSALKALEDAGVTTSSLANLSALAGDGLGTLSSLSSLVSGGLTGLDASSLSGLSGLSSLSGLGNISALSGLSSLSGLSADSLSGLTSSVDSLGSTSYSASRTAVITVIPTERMLLDIDVDEMDINSVQVGQAAEVTLDAIQEQTFEGTITSVASTADNSGGVAKYKVELEIPRTEEMKFGMSATAAINVDSRSDVLTIPMDALQSDGSNNVVYTSIDRNGNFSDPVPVETGLSTSETVEIISGLSEGDSFYYIPSNGGGSIIEQYREEQEAEMNGTSTSEEGQ